MGAIEPVGNVNARTITDALELAHRGIGVRISDDEDGAMVTVTCGFPGRYAAAFCGDDGEVHLILEEPPGMPQVTRTSANDAVTGLLKFLARNRPGDQ